MAQAWLGVRTTVLEAIRAWVSLAHTDAVADVEDRKFIVGVECETDHLPVGEVGLPGRDARAEVSENSLFSFVDLKDPFSPSEITGEDLPGPILSLIEARKFDFLFLFHTPHTRNNALKTKREILRRRSDCRVGLHELPVPDPKDYSMVMAQLTREIRELVGQILTRKHLCLCLKRHGRNESGVVFTNGPSCVTG